MLIDKINAKIDELQEDLEIFHKNSFDERVNNLSDEEKEKYERLNKSSCILSLSIGTVSLIFTIALICLAILIDEMIIFGIGAAVFFLICAIFFLVYSIKLHKRNKTEIYIAHLRADDKRHFDESSINFPQEAANIIINEYFKSINFSYTQKIHIAAVKDKWQYIYLNSEIRKFKYLNLENDVDVTVDFDDIVNYEIYEDEKEIVNGNAAGVFWGGALFGVAGALIAQNLPKEVQKSVTTLKLIIRLNNFSQPQIVIDFIDNNLNPNSEYYKTTLEEIYENLRLIYSHLEIIKHNAYPRPQSKTSELQQQNDLKEELRKLKELYDNALITQEEFDAKKKQLLGL